MTATTAVAIRPWRDWCMAEGCVYPTDLPKVGAWFGSIFVCDDCLKSTRVEIERLARSLRELERETQNKRWADSEARNA